EVETRHHGAGQVVAAVEAEDGALEGREPAVRGALAPQGARDRVEVQVREVDAPPRDAGEQVAGLEERQIERPAVEGDELPRVPDPLAHGVKKGRLRGQVSEEVLGEAQARGQARRRAEEEDIG